MSSAVLHTLIVTQMRSVKHTTTDSFSIHAGINTFILGLLDYDRNHNQAYFGQNCNLTRL